MTNKTILQIPISVSLRDQALRVAEEMGFSSLQELIRVFLRQLVNKNVFISFKETEVKNDSAQVLLKIAELGKKNRVKGPKDAAERHNDYLYGKNWSKNK